MKCVDKMSIDVLYYFIFFNHELKYFLTELRNAIDNRFFQKGESFENPKKFR